MNRPLLYLLSGVLSLGLAVPAVQVVATERLFRRGMFVKSGDALDFTVAPPYSVVVGRADAVAVTVRGQAFDVSPFARNSVARFQVK